MQAGDRVKLNKSLNKAIDIDEWISAQNRHDEFQPKIKDRHVYTIYKTDTHDGVQIIKLGRVSYWFTSSNFKVVPKASIFIDMEQW